MTTVLTIGYGRALFDEGNTERRRMEACARVVDALHMIVFSKKEHRCAPVHVGKLSIYPTHSRSHIGMLFDAYKIGSAILRVRGAKKDATENNWIISAQDPFEAGLVGYVLHLRYGIPLQVQEHGDFFGGPWWRNEQPLNRIRHVFGKWLLRHANCVRAVSARVAKHLVVIGVDPRKITTLAVSSDLAAFVKRDSSRDTHDLRARYPDAEAVVLAVGRLVKEKNFPSLIRAFAIVVRLHQSAQLVIVGSGPEENDLTHLVEEHGLSGVVSLIPWTDNVAAYMHSADIFVLCSYREGWGRVIIEAMTAGLPGVITDVGCVGEAFIDGRHGIVVPVDDADALADALGQLIADPQKRRQFGEAAARDGSAFAAHQGLYADVWHATIESCIAGKGAV